VVLIGLLALVFIVAPDELGRSRIPEKAEEFTKRLREGKAYQFIASHIDGSDKILLVREKGTQNYYAIRVNAARVPLRENSYLFTLVEGEIVEIK
jgi:DNA/RNA endonuclease YhcR with UshA esterase domain